jgi:hypothetical protein
MPSPTTHFGWTQPTVGGDTGAWGTILNTMHDLIDADIRVNAGKPSEQLLIPAVNGHGLQWNSVEASRPSLTAFIANTPGNLYVPIGERLRVGQRITGFTSKGAITPNAAATVELWYTDSSGDTQVSAGHSLPGSLGETTTSGLTHDVVADRAYFIKVDPSGPTGSIELVYVKLTVIKTP